jgi:hypothetical protein
MPDYQAASQVTSPLAGMRSPVKMNYFAVHKRSGFQEKYGVHDFRNFGQSIEWARLFQEPRSSGIWNLDYGKHVSEIPIGFGVCKLWTLPGGTVMNCFFEPQYSVYRAGTGARMWQILSGITFQFPNRAKGNLP